MFPDLPINFLQQIRPDDLPSVFKISLDTSLLSSLLETFHALLRSGVDPQTVKPYLANLPRVSRWKTLIMFLSRTEKEVVKEIWDNYLQDADDLDLRKAWGMQ